MKKIVLCTVVYLSSATLFGQLKVETTGNVKAVNNMDIDGMIGGSKGVLNVSSNRMSPNYNPYVDQSSLQLIRTVCTNVNFFPFLNYYSRTGANPTQADITFYIKGNGQIYTKTGILQPAAASTALRSALVSSSLKSPLQKLKTLHGIVYTEPVQSPAPASRSALAGESTPDPAMTNQPPTEADSGEASVRIGLSAQELERVFPEVVRELPDGSKGILYSDLIPVLIESIKELQDSLTVQTGRVAALEQQLNAPAASPGFAPQANSATGVPGNPDQANGAALYQNTPNPFNRETEIAYRLPAGANAASVCIYNLNGQQLKKYPLSADALSGTVTVSASEFAPGMYLYSLIIDSRVIDSKRMTLTD